MSARRRTALSLLALLFLITACTAYAQSALQFVALAPCRVVDTRWAPGQFGGPPISGGTERDFTVPASSCGVPDDAAAYSLNVTVVPQGTLGYLTVWPKGQSRPVISTLNSLDGRTKANAAIVPAGTDGAISVYATNTTNVVLDIDGYFVPASSSTLAFFPLTPCRVADTRWSRGPLGGPTLAQGEERDFPVLSSSCGIPASAKGYSLNFTAVPVTSLAYLTVWPTGQSKPLVSTLNDPTGTIVANAAIVPAGTGGAIGVYPSDNTNLVIDVDGYFAPSASGADPLSLYTLPPCRALDTRNGLHAFSGMIPVGILQSGCNVPSAQAYVLNATVIPQNSGPLAYLTLWPDTETKPVVSTLNALDGAITSNMAIVPTLNGSVDAYATNPTDLVLDIFSYFAPIASLSVVTNSLPSATVSNNYSTTLAAAGGVTPYTWSISSGALPPGLNLAPSSGVISGTPTMAGNYSFTAKVTDSQSSPATASAALGINVTSTIAQLSMVTTSLPSGTQNGSYNTMLAATGGITPYTWSITSGNLPIGLVLNSSTGSISGTPYGGGTSNFTVQVSDAEGPPKTATASFAITIAPAVPLSITSLNLPNGTVELPYNASLTAVGGVYPYTWTITSGNLPRGLSLNTSTGAITGTPILTGTATFTVKVTDSELQPQSLTAQLSITVTANTSGAGALTGNYAFYLNGFTSSGAWTLAGSFISDGNGNITSGVVDGNSIGGQPFNATVTGNYAIGSNGLNLITLVGQSYGPVTYAFVLSSSGNGRIVEYDDTTGSGSRGSGVLREQNPAAFSLSDLAGGYAYEATGRDNSGDYTINIGAFSLSSGNITNGVCDVNKGGTYGSCTFTGTLSPVDTQTGRTVITLQGSDGTSHEAAYVVSASELVLERNDPGSGLAAGQVLQQSGPFSNASLNGNVVMYGHGIYGSYDFSNAMIASFDGHGNWTMLDGDEDAGGVITHLSTYQGTYSVAANGAVTRTNDHVSLVGFMVSQNKAILVTDVDISYYLDIVEPQTGGPFSNQSISGTYEGGSLVPLDYAYAVNDVSVNSANGQGVISQNGDASKPDGLAQWTNYLIDYSIGSDGRGTTPGNPSGTEGVFYVISPTKWIGLNAERDARLTVLQH